MRFNEFHDEHTDEMIGVKKYQHLTLNHAIEIIAKDMGTQVLGAGAYGTVVASTNPNVVYKVLESDHGYMAFIRFVQRVSDKHFPKVYKVKNLTHVFKRYGIQNDKFVVVALEKLQPIDQKKLGMNAEFIASLLNTHSPQEPPKMMPNGGRNNNQVPASEFLQYIPELKSLWTASMKLRGIGVESPDYFWDIHPDNLMMRADGTIVITDPFGSYSGFDYKDKIQAARSAKEPMVKGPKHRTEPAQPDPDDIDAVREVKRKIAELEAKPDISEEEKFQLVVLRKWLAAREQEFK